MTKPEPWDNFIKRSMFSIITIVIIVLYFSSMSSTNLLSLFYSILIILPIRFIKDKHNKKTNFKAMYSRIIHCRPKHKIRTIISGLLFILFFVPSLVNIIGNIHENNIDIAKQEAYNNAPEPSIKILSDYWDMWNITWYMLKYKTLDSDEVIVNGKSYSWNNESNSIVFSLEEVGKSELEITIIARNKYKSSEKKISIKRSKTNEELRLEKEEEIRVANEKAQQKIDTLNTYIEEMKGWYNYYDVSTISATVYRFEILWSFIEKYLGDEDSKVISKAKEAKNKLISTQKTLFPKLRTKWCDLTKDTMRRYDIDVKCYWTRISFIWWTFASNANIEDSYLVVKDMLYLLRFKQARFYRYEGSDYTYYTLNSISDLELKK